MQTRKLTTRLHFFSCPNCAYIYKYYSETHNEMIGKRIIDVSYILKQIKDSKHNGGFWCNFNDMDFVSEDRRGCYSEFLFKCRMCYITKKIWSVKKSPKTNRSINKALVNSIIAIGTKKIN